LIYRVIWITQRTVYLFLIILYIFLFFLAAFYGDQAVNQPFYTNDRYGTDYQASPEYMGGVTASSRNYTQLNEINHHHAQAYQVLDALQNEKKHAYDTQIKMEFDDCSSTSGSPHNIHQFNHQYNGQSSPQQFENYQTDDHLSQSLPDTRSYSPHHLTVPHHPYQRTKSLSHPPSPNNMDSSSSCASSDGGDSPRMQKKTISMSSASATSSANGCGSDDGKKESSRPRMYKFNPKPLTLNPSMKRMQTPTDNKDNEYWEKRKKNNEASRRSRLARRLKECLIMEEMKKLKKENEDLKAELSKMQNAGICRM